MVGRLNKSMVVELGVDIQVVVTGCFTVDLSDDDTLRHLPSETNRQ